MGWADDYAARNAPSARENNYHSMPPGSGPVRDVFADRYAGGITPDVQQRMNILASSPAGQRTLVRLQAEGKLPRPVSIYGTAEEPPPSEMSAERRLELLSAGCGTGAATIRRLRAEGKLPPEQP